MKSIEMQLNEPLPKKISDDINAQDVDEITKKCNALLTKISKVMADNFFEIFRSKAVRKENLDSDLLLLLMIRSLASSTLGNIVIIGANSTNKDGSVDNKNQYISSLVGMFMQEFLEMRQRSLAVDVVKMCGVHEKR